MHGSFVSLLTVNKTGTGTFKSISLAGRVITAQKIRTTFLTEAKINFTAFQRLHFKPYLEKSETFVKGQVMVLGGHKSPPRALRSCGMLKSSGD